MKTVESHVSHYININLRLIVDILNTWSNSGFNLSKSKLETHLTNILLEKIVTEIIFSILKVIEIDRNRPWSSLREIRSSLIEELKSSKDVEVLQFVTSHPSFISKDTECNSLKSQNKLLSDELKKFHQEEMFKTEKTKRSWLS